MRITNMRLLVTFFVVIAMTAGKPISTKLDESLKTRLISLVKQTDMRNVPAIKELLKSYMKIKFPKLQIEHQRRMVKTLVFKIKDMIKMRALNKHSNNVWMGKGDMLARMLK